MEQSQEQGKKQRYDYIRGYQFVKGQSGNPGGRPKGSKSLKTFAREYLEALPDEEKLEFLKSLPEELVWRMSEGQPKQDIDTKTDGTLNIKVINYGNNNDSLPLPAETISVGTTESVRLKEIQ